MDLQRIRTALKDAVTRGDAPGMSLGIVAPGGDVCVYTTGHRTLLPRPEPLHLETLFDLASLTKVLATTTLVMGDVEAGRLELDRPLGDVLPAQYGEQVARLTPRLLLLHAAGLPPHIPFYRTRLPSPADPAAQREEILHCIRHLPLEYPPGSRSVYSDLGMILMGDLLERLHGDSLDRLFEHQVAQPLGLADTFFRHLDHPLAKARRPATAFAATERCPWRESLIRGRVHDENAYLLRGVAGHAGLFSTVENVLRLCRTLLAIHGGEKGLLTPETVRLFTSPQRGAEGTDRVLGWARSSPQASCGKGFSPRAFGHTGFTGTSAWLDPATGLIVVLLSHRVHPTRDNRAFLAFRPRLHDLVTSTIDA